MDYTTQTLGFKLRKALRYARLFGIRRTLVKIRGQYHMKRRFARLPEPKLPKAGGRVALIGCGNYAFSNLAYYANCSEPGCLRAAVDIDIHKAASIFDSYKLAYYGCDADQILRDPDINFVFVASNHASHAEYAIRCLEAGKDVHIEKPHVVSFDQLARLRAAMRARPEVKVFLGFNRPRSPLFRQLTTFLAAETGPLMINWFVAGHEIAEDHWYFKSSEGGRVLGNLCHWSDLTLHMVGRENAFPCTIVPASAPTASSDFAVSIRFADGSMASITFSAKGHTFEGVREVLNVHRGNLLANLTDFQHLSAEVIDRRISSRLVHRDHGHGTNIEHSLHSPSGESVEYVTATGMFILCIREALESGRTVVLEKAEAFGEPT
jgi:predicted dehydrogenase